MTMLFAALLLLLTPAAALAFDPFQMAGIDERPDAEVPLDLSFVDENGKAVTLAELAGGKPILLAPVLHNCPNICGVTLSGLGQAIAAQDYVPGRDFAVIAFGIDPHEGVAEAKASVDALGQQFPKLRGSLRALTGTTSNIHAVTNALGYRYAWDERIGQYAHVAAVAVLTPDGHLSRWLYGLTPDPTDLTLALTEAGQGEIGDWRDQLLLLCYHYNPENGRYGPIIWTALRIGGGLTATLGIAFIGLAVMREQRTSRRGRT